MKLRCLVFACFSLTLSMFASSASAGCWTCSGCCVEQDRGKYGYGACSAIQMCIETGCGCTSCSTSGSLCSGTAEPKCENVNGICEQHQTTRHEAAPEVVPNGDPIDLLWLIDPPALPEGGVRADSNAACATLV